MATVRMTQQMASSISRKAMEKWETANPSPSALPEFKQFVRGAVQRMPILAFVKEFSDKPEVQAAAKHNTNLTNYISGLIEETEHSKVYIEHIPAASDGTFNLPVEFDTPVRLPGQNSYRTPDIEIDMFAADDKDEIIRRANVARAQEDQWAQQRRTFQTSIDQIIDSCNTVKQLLDVWPAAEKLLDADVIQRLHTKVTRKIDADAVRQRANFDPDQANQVLLTSSLLGD